MDIRQLILNNLKTKGRLKASEIMVKTGFSRAYVNRFFNQLLNEGKIVRIGKANLAYYIPAGKENFEKAKKSIWSVKKILANRGLSEDLILDQIKRQTGIFMELPRNIGRILDYAFTEMLNNAIEHSKSVRIEVKINRDKESVRFEITDAGIGIFQNIKSRKELKSDLEAIQDLLKGKQTTAPSRHTGEGIFFTSKMADMLIIQSSNKKLIFNNLLGDIFIEDSKKIKGTKVFFSINIKAKTEIEKVFREFTDKEFEFSKTKVLVKLYKLADEYISRSQARRIFAGLEKFKTIILDFKQIETVGQAFADEVFRVWQAGHPNIKIEIKNANDNVMFMINRAK